MLTAVRSRVGQEAGITIVELLVVMVLMSIIGSIATASLVRGMKVSAATQSRVHALADLQKSVDRMTRELRAAAPLRVGGNPVVAAASDRVVVNVFRNNFAEVRRFTYQYCPAQQRVHVRAEGPWSPAAAPTVAPAAVNCTAPADPVLIDRVTNTTAMFSYAYTATTPVKVATIRVTVRRSLPNGQPPIEVTTLVRLRNVR